MAIGISSQPIPVIPPALGYIAMIASINLQELAAIAELEFLRHSLQDWSFGLARTKRRQGVCKYQSKRNEIAKYYATHNPPEKVIDMLLLEIAHALAGPKARHGPTWKAVARKLGATPRAYDTCRETVVVFTDREQSLELIASAVFVSRYDAAKAQNNRTKENDLGWILEAIRHRWIGWFPRSRRRQSDTDADLGWGRRRTMA
jgi:hypothetical protein